MAFGYREVCGITLQDRGRRRMGAFFRRFAASRTRSAPRGTFILGNERTDVLLMCRIIDTLIHKYQTKQRLKHCTSSNADLSQSSKIVRLNLSPFRENTSAAHPCKTRCRPIVTLWPVARGHLGGDFLKIV